MDASGQPILISKGHGGDAVLKFTSPAASAKKSSSKAPVDDFEVSAPVFEEDVDEDDVGTDGSFFRDERGAVEFALPFVAASFKVSPGVTPQFAVPSERVPEVTEAGIPVGFDAIEQNDGSVCRILDNFFICYANGYVLVALYLFALAFVTTACAKRTGGCRKLGTQAT